MVDYNLTKGEPSQQSEASTSQAPSSKFELRGQQELALNIWSYKIAIGLPGKRVIGQLSIIQHPCSSHNFQMIALHLALQKEKLS
ncbi:hypothetical protein Chor_007183 [Crotalus horridus]